MPDTYPMADADKDQLAKLNLILNDFEEILTAHGVNDAGEVINYHAAAITRQIAAYVRGGVPAEKLIASIVRSIEMNLPNVPDPL